MDSTMDLTTNPTSTVPPAPANSAATATPQRSGGHPLIWAALLVWLSVEAIGDSLLALRTVLATATAGRSTTRTVTPS
ncbi:MAG: hypothetical protein ACO3EF_07475 [Vulcanococcus sp.]